MPEHSSGQALPPGTRLEEFEIVRVLGSGGFGITYLARDSRLGRQVVIKENLPVQFCFRDPSSLTVSPRHSQGEDAESFAWALENFEKEAAMLASLDHPGIVKVHRSFEAFGTAYFVMPFVEGAALDEQIRERHKAGGHFTEEELLGLLWWLLGALDYLNARGIYHRDIKPGNILVISEGSPVLIDFGAARQRLGERSLTVIESPGYTPFEQLQSRGKVGPWSDIYALGATLYKAITGETPAKATDRAFDDPIKPLSGCWDLVQRYGVALLETVDRALAVRAGDRWQESREWQDALRGGDRNRGQVARTEEERSFRTAASPEGISVVPSAEAFVMEGDAAGEQCEVGGIVMVWCPPGEFRMGSPGWERGRGGDETLHGVSLTKGFWLAKYPCTQEQWEGVMGRNPSRFKGAGLPVEGVSWEAVRAWLKAMNVARILPAGWVWDLPLEAQWEYACRAGTTGAFSGTGDLDEMGWYRDNSGGRPHPVGRKRPNDWGLHDMHGNVSEWCRDWYRGYPTEAVKDPCGPEAGTLHVVRGGSWWSIAAGCRSACRDVRISSGWADSLGFRVALTYLS